MSKPRQELHDSRGHHYFPGDLKARDRQELTSWLAQLQPIWEQRYSTRRSPPEGQTQRELLRPVYWLGNWQFACLDYYRPPRGTLDRCVAAEPFPGVQRVDKRAGILLPPEIEGFRTRRINFTLRYMPAEARHSFCQTTPRGPRRRARLRRRAGRELDFLPSRIAGVSE